MNVKGDYKLPPEDEEPLRRTMLKGIGAVTILIVIVLMAAVLTVGRLSQQVSLMRDVVGAFAMLLVIHQYSRSIAGQRLLLARDYRKKGKPSLVMAALLPYTKTGFFTSRTRFDSTGEAHYLLAWAAKACGEDAVLAYCKTFLAKFRRGEWTKRTLKL